MTAARIVSIWSMDGGAVIVHVPLTALAPVLRQR